MAKKYNIKYTSRFMIQFHEILFHIRFELKNEIAAERISNEIVKAIEKRSICPEAFQIFKSYSNNRIKYYKINVKSYSIFYQIENGVMIVCAIYYSKRDLDEMIK